MIIDRFEGEYAVCELAPEDECGMNAAKGCGQVPEDENKKMPEEVGAAHGENESRRIKHINIRRELIDERAGEGSIIFYCAGRGRYILDEEATNRRTVYIRELTKNMWK